jgi:type IV pilus biogenesis protein CpaD/CtpE
MARESMSAAMSLVIQEIPAAEGAAEAAKAKLDLSTATAANLAAKIQAEQDLIESRDKIVAQANNLSETCPLIREASLAERHSMK